MSKHQKPGVWITEFPQKRSKLKPNKPVQAIRRGHSSCQPPFFRILLAHNETQGGNKGATKRKSY